MQQTGFHLRSSTRETKDLPVSKRANESFLAKGDIYAYRVTGRAASLSLPLFFFFCHMAPPRSLGIEALGVYVWPLGSEVICFTPGHTKPSQWQVFQVTNYDLQVGNHDPKCI